MKIYFCHNTHLDLALLKENISNSKSMYPDSEFFLFSDGLTLTEEEFGPNIINHPKKLGHKIGCTYSLAATLKLVSKHLSQLNEAPNFVVYSHDDVYIKSKEIFESHLTSGKDVIFREIIHPNYVVKDSCYVAIDCLIFKPSAIQALDLDNLEIPIAERNLPKDKRGSRCPELFWGNIFSKKLSYQSIKTQAIIQGEVNEMGFYHIKKKRKK
ncbi:MAG: hypothetical protein OEY09_02815 [Gammaproteobacteria bacterium]|nr:hypothetical protein [Gammaproteobacteria bacterium]